ncbi:MAG TPA: T9SS type A sorting domain-containing protein [Caldithrix abyssi]|uniref:T9SS type A sorting domain-containing protein n=1 Tax=Caldithrix abyssi TaxID=187145 RepID=A0A7V4WWH6_CALAY|nr:T9SS type A sorting domain-containing protein [Caldithrix abyssi]
MRKILPFILSVVFFSWAVSVYAQNAWINEFHYDDASTDENEFIEVVIENAGSYNLADFTVTLYNGNGGGSYKSTTLDLFTVGNTEGNFTFYYYNYTQNGSSIQNGSPDGFALDYQGTVISGQFLSYEGTFTATDGPANGLTSDDVGVSESGVPEGQSLQLSGSGGFYSDFTWQDPATNTMGALNNGQTLGTVTNTVVKFASSSGSVGEGDGTYNLAISIVNPDANNATSVDVVLISGDPADVGNYTTQTVTFPAGSSDDQILVINITDDSQIEGDEVVTFELQNVSGGNNASIGSPSQFDLTILDNDFASTPDIVINEIMQNPNAVGDDVGEWYELYNAGDTDVDINGWIMKDNDTDVDTIQNGGPLIISAGGYLVLGINDTTSVNGGVNVDYVYKNFLLSNSSDEIVLLLSDGVSEVDRVEWDNGATFPDPTGKSMELINPGYDNNDGTNWQEATATYGDGDMGTPGALNSTYVSGIKENPGGTVSEFRLHPNFPNPFNPSTTLTFDVPGTKERIDLIVYDLLGKKVKTLFSGKLNRGRFQQKWDGRNEAGLEMPSGVYFAVLKSNTYRKAVKMMLLR